VKKCRFNILCLLVIVVLFSSCNISIYDLFDYCKSHSEVKLGEVTNFKWDVAYLDFEAYGHCSELSEKYNITVPESFRKDNRNSLGDDNFAIAFCKDGEVVEYSQFRRSTLLFGTNEEDRYKFVGEIYPDTVFKIEWEKDEEDEMLKLVMEN